MKLYSSRQKILFVLAIATSLTAITPAFADLMIMPIRTIFTERDRTKSITLINQADTPATFRFAFTYNKQNEAGALAPQDTAIDPKYDLAKMLVYSPRQVQLGAREKQAVRISVRRPEQLPNGEYRVYLNLRRIPGINREFEIEAAKKKGVAAALFVNVGFAVPIIYRVGNHDASASISDLKILPASADGKIRPRANFTLHRKGLHSTLGKGTVYWTAPGGKSEKQIGIQNNLNVFPEVTQRAVNIPLDEVPKGGTLRIVYEGEDIDKDIIFDDKKFPL